MRVLFVSGEMIAGDLAYRLKKEGCDVKLFIEDESRKDCFENMVDKTDDWRKELGWVGKDGLIVFDDVGYGKEQDDLRRQGYSVVGGSEGGDVLEKDREFGQKVLRASGVNSLETFNFKSAEDAIKFIRENECPWVLKQNGHASSLTCIGKVSDGSDIIEVLESYKNSLSGIGSLSLQRKVDGIEIAVGRYFNGSDWVGPIEINVEHKHLFNGDIGPLTGEMGTLMWYTKDRNKLFEETLAKIKPFLRRINFRGDIDINCIVDKSTIYPLELTSRFGCPSTHLQEKIHISPWKDFLTAVAKGEDYCLEYRSGYGIVVSVAIPPFPYQSISKEGYLKGASIFFDDGISQEDWERIHFEEVSLKECDGKDKYCVAGSNGYILYVTGFGETISEARDQAYGLIGKIVIPKMFYRTDIGLRFENEYEQVLMDWGWI